MTLTQKSHHSRSTVGRAAAVGALAALALAGCSSSDDPAPSTSASSSASTSASTSASSQSSTSAPTSSSSSSSTSASSTGSAAPGLPAGAKQLSVTVTGKEVDPAPGVVELAAGQTLRITVTSDHDDELHAHGFEKEGELVAGQPTTLDLVTDQPGTYEVETHHPALRLLKVQVR